MANKESVSIFEKCSFRGNVLDTQFLDNNQQEVSENSNIM